MEAQPRCASGQRLDVEIRWLWLAVASWDTELVAPGSNLYGISCPTSDHCFAVGSHGTIIAN
jgi:hypothetical protein